MCSAEDGQDGGDRPGGQINSGTNEGSCGWDERKGHRYVAVQLGAIGNPSNNHPRLTLIIDMQSNLKEMCDKQNILLGDCTRIIGFMNRLYSFMASNPVFNAADGTGRKACT